jgi:hypothetical protein
MKRIRAGVSLLLWVGILHAQEPLLKGNTGRLNYILINPLSGKRV